jgi:hypothetical protein
VELAKRPENLPLVRESFEPDAYFIDTTVAQDLQECADPRHPLTRQEDIRWRIELCDYARELFGLFGSECGREWAVPHVDFFEGIASVGSRYYHLQDLEELGGRAVPFFDMIFHDCVALYGKYEYGPEEMAEIVLHHIAMGRTFYYHSLPHHLYWQTEADRAAFAECRAADEPRDRAVFTRAHLGWAEGLHVWDRFMKNTHEVLGPLNAMTSESLIHSYEFLDSARLVRRTTFGNGVTAVVNGSDARHLATSRLGGEVLLPPFGFLVEAPSFAAFHACSWGGREYQEPVLFTLRSLDGEPLKASRKVRVYHGFGDPQLTWRAQAVEVRREATL